MGVGQVGTQGSQMRTLCLPLSFNITEIERHTEKMASIGRKRGNSMSADRDRERSERGRISGGGLERERALRQKG